MNWLREIVSGKRKRFQDDNYNLDITYITDRVLAMSFPAQGFESLYRNSIENVRLNWKINLLKSGRV
jgi:phosphatidylinositol-3,4,5-trisphosphate 3-phosphatase and dual-specificity protein phosphatase PTEN